MVAGLVNPRRVSIELVRDRAHYDRIVMGAVAKARVSVWIATANVKGLRVEALPGTRVRRAFVSILDIFGQLASRRVELRLLHAGLPSRAFRSDLEKNSRLRNGALSMRWCPRVHLKMIAVDGAILYLGSANFTGAGLGAKGDHRRNFEAGILTDDDVILDEMQGAFDRLWLGRSCAACKLRSVCPAPLDTLGAVSRLQPGARSPKTIA
jgi:phosphatidylserine/phosphatidylglycerophosphate/cardiolipin synthase-like enzyme